MRIWETAKIRDLLRKLEAGEEIPPDLLAKCKQAVEREIDIQEKRSERYRAHWEWQHNKWQP